ncbi:prenyltransferase/squalene oxidase repeat-containing protein [Planctomycetes bacterium K23_9]|uniref:Sporulenol synthase n=1 Tax=Stieleria marina TaxID=1930275 RepID=A0A517NRF7_9BACT|nr:Sporulenol synthase [Planctomycetes bacterium K23_9]
MPQQQRDRVRQTLDQLRSELLAERTPQGHWTGELSASALSTATAVSALSAVSIHQPTTREATIDLIRRGVDYLRTQQNDDGGFGDTDLSHSNIATSYLVLAATTLAEKACGESLDADRKRNLAAYIERQGATDGLRRRYGKDKTFVVPILTNLAIAGLVDWNDVQALPFEAAVFPQSMYRFLQIPVVSYAIPALVAIGQARHFHGRRAFALLRWIRSASVGRTMNKLVEIQPASGGYLEATPLTAFVVMSLAATGRADHQVSQKGSRFLENSIRDDGSWPIDTNLATWVTSLSVGALACDPDDDGNWCNNQLVDWHLSCQLQERHPFTGADPGGWGWTDLSGSVPDGDDTPGAMLAIKQHRKWVDAKWHSELDQAFDNGERFLHGLQNRDGGWPTFCRGWGKLPFDRSSVDLTAHALRAIGDRIEPAKRAKAVQFIHQQQLPDGSWLPLWFGNQDLPDETNPVYGTSRVLIAGCVSPESSQRGIRFLLKTQNDDGGWGGGPSVRDKLVGSAPQNGPAPDQNLASTVEETALAVEALTTFVLFQRDLGADAGVQSNRRAAEDGFFVKNESLRGAGDGEKDESENTARIGAGTNELPEAIISGVDFLLRSVDDGRHRIAWPIGFYFAKLWYHEKLYPLVFTVAALGKYLRATAEEHQLNWPK